jgi:hypothetical protein
LIEIGQHASDGMPKPARHPMPFDGRTNRLSHNQPHARTRFAIAAPAHMNDEIGLRCAHPVLHCRVEFP